MSLLKIHRKKTEKVQINKRGEPNIFQIHLIDLLKIRCHAGNMPISIKTFDWLCYNKY